MAFLELHEHHHSRQLPHRIFLMDGQRGCSMENWRWSRHGIRWTSISKAIQRLKGNRCPESSFPESLAPLSVDDSCFASWWRLLHRPHSLGMQGWGCWLDDEMNGEYRIRAEVDAKGWIYCGALLKASWSPPMAASSMCCLLARIDSRTRFGCCVLQAMQVKFKTCIAKRHVRSLPFAHGFEPLRRWDGGKMEEQRWDCPCLRDCRRLHSNTGTKPQQSCG